MWPVSGDGYFLAIVSCLIWIFFFFNDTATTEIYTLSLHDALPISRWAVSPTCSLTPATKKSAKADASWTVPCSSRSEEHTSELQSQSNLVCRLLLEKKKRRTPLSPASSDPTHLPHCCAAAVSSLSG